MASVNKVMLVGNLGADPELRYTQNQTAVASFSIATTEKMGEKEHTEWHKIVTWNKTAENCSKYLAKGKSVFVEGRIRTRSWEDKEGQRRWATEIQADRVVFLGGGKKEESDADYNQSGSGASGNSAEW